MKSCLVCGLIFPGEDCSQIVNVNVCMGCLYECRRFDIKWTAPKAEGSLSDARGDVIISHDHICVNSSSAAFELYTKVLTSYPDEDWLYWRESNKVVDMPFSVEGVELDLRMRNFEFFNLISSYTFDSLRPVHLKATGKIKFQGKVNKNSCSQVSQSDANIEMAPKAGDEDEKSISGDISISGLKLNQLMIAPQLAGVFNITSKGMKVCLTAIYLTKSYFFLGITSECTNKCTFFLCT